MEINHISYETLCERIKEMSKTGRIIIGIDGRCGAGKTTLAQKLAIDFHASVIFMDDFFLPPNLRTPNRLKEAGGNIHYERFINEVIKGLQTQKEFSYRKFDCSVMDYSFNRIISPSDIIIVEGSYSLHPKFQAVYDLKIFLTVSKDLQEERILMRNGPKQLDNFKNKWIPMEETYFTTYQIMEHSDYCIEMNA